MPHSALTPCLHSTGRYAAKVENLRPIFSEYGLMKRRVRVEVLGCSRLADAKDIAEVAPFSASARATLLAIADDFTKTSGGIKAIERTTNHDVKAVEYFIKERHRRHAELSKAAEVVHFAVHQRGHQQSRLRAHAARRARRRAAYRRSTR